MSTELVERLNAGIRYLPRMATEDSAEYRDFRDAGDAIAVNEGDLWNALFAMRQAADELTALTAKVALLTEALKPFAGAADDYDPDEGDDSGTAWLHDFTIGSLRRARRALSEPDKDAP